MFSDTNAHGHPHSDSECYAHNNTQHNADTNSRSHFHSQSNTEASSESPTAPEPANYAIRETNGCGRVDCTTWTADADCSPFAVSPPGSNSKTNSSGYAQNNTASASNSAEIKLHRRCTHRPVAGFRWRACSYTRRRSITP